MPLRWSEGEYRRYLQRQGKADGQDRPKDRKGRGSLAPDSMPQARLTRAVEARWPGRFKVDASRVIPGRRFTVDLLDTRLKAVIEVDGYQFHALHKKGFLRDREKDYLLTMAGYRILRLSAGLIFKDLATAVERVGAFITMLEQERGANCRARTGADRGSSHARRGAGHRAGDRSGEALKRVSGST